MSASKRALRRLREDPAHIKGLVEVLIDEALERPVNELVDPSTLARALSEGVRQAAASEELQSWVEERFEAAGKQADRLEGSLGDHLPMTMLEPLESIVGRELTPDRRLVDALLNHPSFRDLLAAILQQNVLEFASRLRSFVPGPGRVPGGKLTSRLAEVAKGVASAVGPQVEQSLEARARAFVDDALERAVQMAIDRFASSEFAAEMARWRVDVLHALLSHPLEHIIEERHKYPAQDFAADISSILRALAGWTGLADAVEEGLGRAFAEFGDKTAQSWLEGSGLPEAWRPQLEVLMTERLSSVVATPAFGTWLSTLIED